MAATPAWVWPVLVLGAAIMVAWAWFIVGFLSEPSAVGRSRIVLLTSIVYSIGAAFVGVLGAAGLARKKRWGRTLAGIASAAMASRADRHLVESQLFETLSYFDASLSR